eukprot:TRINITY_DN42992_c0_g1_i1.p1 TRINITY_DN42992_c0_g1~~TRINITY_DN42992_c0_g1_i1.p1  ORF type:complete len:153 (+),score=5.28 TRINITY_DN42992_c0_g1_i1:59-517(+)
MIDIDHITSPLVIYINLPCSRKTHHHVALIHFQFFASTPLRNKTFFFFLKNAKEQGLDKLSPNNFFIRYNVTTIHPAILLHSCPMHIWLASMGVNTRDLVSKNIGDQTPMNNVDLSCHVDSLYVIWLLIWVFFNFSFATISLEKLSKLPSQQ